MASLNLLSGFYRIRRHRMRQNFSGTGISSRAASGTPCSATAPARARTRNAVAKSPAASNGPAAGCDHGEARFSDVCLSARCKVIDVHLHRPRQHPHHARKPAVDVHRVHDCNRGFQRRSACCVSPSGSDTATNHVPHRHHVQ